MMKLGVLSGGGREFHPSGGIRFLVVDTKRMRYYSISGVLAPTASLSCTFLVENR